MADEKKVSTTFYLHEGIKPVIGDNGEELFPVYVRVNYNRNNTQFRYIGGPLLPVEASITIQDRSFVKVIGDLIERIVEFEAEKYGDKYTLKGLNKRFVTYVSNFYEPLKKGLLTKLGEVLKGLLAYNDFIVWSNKKFEDQLGDAFDYITHQKPEAWDKIVILQVSALAALYNHQEKCIVAGWLFFNLENTVKMEMRNLDSLPGTTMVFERIPVVDMLDDQSIRFIFLTIDKVCFELLNAGYVDPRLFYSDEDEKRLAELKG
jgi:hypothetical protein